jgi:hypothetical protein
MHGAVHKFSLVGSVLPFAIRALRPRLLLLALPDPTSPNLFGDGFGFAKASLSLRVNLGPRGRGEAKRLALQLAALCQTVFAMAAANKETVMIDPQSPSSSEGELANQAVAARQSAIARALTLGTHGLESRPTITRAPQGRDRALKVLDIIRRAMTCCEGLPERSVSTATLKSYRRTLALMLRECELDPLRPGIARATYNHRRAALHTAGRHLLMKFVKRCVSAGERDDAAAARLWADVLLRTLVLIEPAVRRDPPLQPGASAWDMPRSRWSELASPRPKKGKNGKKNVLAALPPDWLVRLWRAIPEACPHRAALAVHAVTPARPEELVPGARAHGWSSGVELKLRSPRLLEITIAPVKTHGGKYGTPTTTISIDPIAAGGPAVYLAELCAAAGGRSIVSISSKNAVRKSLARIGKDALPEIDVVITPYVLRHQALADIKVMVGGGEEVAAAAGHCTDRTQSHYGRAEHGRRRRGYLGAKSLHRPRTSNVDRARQLAEARSSPQTAAEEEPAQLRM